MDCNLISILEPYHQDIIKFALKFIIFSFVNGDTLTQIHHSFYLKAFQDKQILAVLQSGRILAIFQK